MTVVDDGDDGGGNDYVPFDHSCWPLRSMYSMISAHHCPDIWKIPKDH